MATGVQVWSQTAATNATIDTAFTWAEGMSPALVNDSARGTMASVAKWRDDNNGTLVTSGSTFAFTVTTFQQEAALTAGYTVAVQFNATNDSSATLNVDSLGAKPLQCIAGINLSGGEFQGGSIGRFTYSSTGTGQWILSNFNLQVVSGFLSATAPDQVFSGGATVTSYNLGTPASGATITVDCGLCPLQYLTNNAPFSISAPANDGACTILFTNGASAGALTFLGFTIGVSVGDPVTLVNGANFLCSIMRINGVSTFFFKALQ